MKKLRLLLILVMVLSLFSSASAIDQKGKLAIGGYGGYAFGFGDFFKKWDVGSASWQNKPSFSFGGKIKYGLAPNIALVGAVEYQAGKSEWEGSIQDIDFSGDKNWNWIGILANVMYVMNPEAKTNPYVTAGGGFYIPDEGDGKPGFNAGLGVEHFFQDNLALDAGARFHMILFESDEVGKSWDSGTYVQGYIGVVFYLGVQ
jgi:hypothetical protein